MINAYYTEILMRVGASLHTDTQTHAHTNSFFRPGVCVLQGAHLLLAFQGTNKSEKLKIEKFDYDPLKFPLRCGQVIAKLWSLRVVAFR